MAVIVGVGHAAAPRVARRRLPHRAARRGLRPLDPDRAPRHRRAGLRSTIARRPGRVGRQLRAGHVRGARALPGRLPADGRRAGRRPRPRLAGGARRAAGHPRRAPGRARGLLADRRAGAVAVRSRVRPGESLPLPRRGAHRARPRRRRGRAAEAVGVPLAGAHRPAARARARQHRGRSTTTPCSTAATSTRSSASSRPSVRMPFARQVPSDVRPIPDVYLSRTLDIGFLLDAKRSGRLDPSTDPLTPKQVNEMKVRLGVAQRRNEARSAALRHETNRARAAPREGHHLRAHHPRPASRRSTTPAGRRRRSRPSAPWTATSSRSSCPTSRSESMRSAARPASDCARVDHRG